MSERRVGVIGAGPAGVMAALGSARRGAQVSLFDANDLVGRKLRATGNGRCNISNLDAGPARYTCADRGWMEALFARISQGALLDALGELGIPTYATADGWCYPLSKSAAAVGDLLAAALEIVGVDTHLTTLIGGIRSAQDGFVLLAADGVQRWTVDRVVVAAGGLAYPALGARGDLLPVLERLGHRAIPPRPALAPILADMRGLRRLQGVRADVGLTLYEGKHALARSAGNVMFTKTGLSGPAAMDLSHEISTRPGAELTLAVDLLARHRQALRDVLDRRRSEPLPLAVALGSVLAPRIAPVLIPMAGVAPAVRLDGMTQAEEALVIHALSELRLRVEGTGGFDTAQVSTGGVLATEVDPATMGSQIVAGLHLAGEVLDVVGPCGGFNLHFAFSSGMLAGAGAGG